MPDSSVYFAAIKAETDRLNKIYPNDCLHVISTRNMQMGSTPGTVSEVSTKIAAKHLAENTARIATEPEIAEFHARGAAFTARMATQQFARKKSDSSGVTFTLTK